MVDMLNYLSLLIGIDNNHNLKEGNFQFTLIKMNSITGHDKHKLLGQRFYKSCCCREDETEKKRPYCLCLISRWAGMQTSPFYKLDVKLCIATVNYSYDQQWCLNFTVDMMSMHLRIRWLVSWFEALSHRREGGGGVLPYKQDGCACCAFYCRCY